MNWGVVCGTNLPVQHKNKGRILHPLALQGFALATPLAVGAFVLVGTVAHSVAGPAVAVAVPVAFIAALLTGLCYTELGLQFPNSHAPASYTLTLCGAGRLVAFLVAWHLALDFVIGAAIAARGVRAAMDSLLNGSLSETFLEVAPLQTAFTSPYVDFVALAVPIFIAVVLIIGRREFAMPQVAASVVVICSVLYIIIAGCVNVNDNSPTRSNDMWLWVEFVREYTSVGKNFMTFGYLGIFQGASILIFSFMGIDKIVATGRRSLNDGLRWGTTNIVTLCFVGVLGVGLVLTHMQSYESLDGNAAVVTAFSALRDPTKWIVCLTVFLGLLAAVTGNMVTASSFLTALESDRLLWSQRFRATWGSIPVTLTVAIVSGLLGAFFQEQHLALVLSSGCVLSMIAIPVSLLLYRCRCEEAGEIPNTSIILRHLVPRSSIKGKSSQASSCAAALEAFIFCVCGAGACAVSLHTSKGAWSLILLVLLWLIAVLALLLLALQPSSKPSGFAIPFAPAVAGLAVLISCSLLVAPTHTSTWIRLVAWSLLGFLVFALRRGGQPPDGLIDKSQENGKSSPPRQDSDFSLDVEQCSDESGADVSSALGTMDTTLSQSQTTDENLAVIVPSVTKQNHANEAVTNTDRIEKVEEMVTNSIEIYPNPAGKAEEIVMVNSIGINLDVVEKEEKTEVIPVVTVTLENQTVSQKPEELGETPRTQEPHDFDETPWNQIWDEHVNSDNSDSDLEKIDIQETVAEVHENSTDLKQMHIEVDRISDTSEDSTLHDITVPPIANTNTFKIVLDLNGDDDVTPDETISDKDTHVLKTEEFGDKSLPVPPSTSLNLLPFTNGHPQDMETKDKSAKRMQFTGNRNDETLFDANDPVTKSKELTHSNDKITCSTLPVPPPMPSTLGHQDKEANKDVASPSQSAAEYKTKEITSFANLRNDLKETLKLRNRKQIENVPNQILNVNETIAVFGGKASKSRPTATDTENNSIKSERQAGNLKHTSFVNRETNNNAANSSSPSTDNKYKEIASSTKLQNELKETLKLRKQKIENSPNQVVNVSETIAVFGGKVPKRRPIATEIENKSAKSAMQTGKFKNESFIKKLNNIVERQFIVASTKEKNPIPHRRTIDHPTVMINIPRDTSEATAETQPISDEDTAIHTEQIRGMLSRMLDARRDPRHGPNTAAKMQNLPVTTTTNKNTNKTRSTMDRTLDALSTDIQIISIT